VSVDGVERKIGGGRGFDDFSARCFQFVAQGLVLGLSLYEVGRVVEAEVAPASGVLGLVPSGETG
jgi:hypothetical protein